MTAPVENQEGPKFSSPGPEDLPDSAGAPPPEGTNLVRRLPEQLVPAAQTSVAEVATTSVGVQARVAVEARFMVAQGRPRNLERVEANLIRSCATREFAEVARYKLPRRDERGRDITGPSIRFAEELARCLGNILPESPVVFDDEWRRVVKVAVSDLEANLSYSQDVVIEKTVERRSKVDREVVGERTNRQNQKVYRVRATDQELLEKQNNLVAKAQRNLIVKLAPAWLVSRAFQAVDQTLANMTQAELPKALERLRDTYEAAGVTQDELERWLGHPLAQVTVAEYEPLRGAVQALRDGEISWDQLSRSRITEAPAKRNGQAAASQPAGASPDHSKDQGKAVVAEVIDMDAKPRPQKPPPADPYLSQQDQPIANQDLKLLLSYLETRDISSLTDLGTNEALRAILAKVRGVEDNDRLFTASLTVGERERVFQAIGELPFVTEPGDALEPGEEAKGDLPGQGE